VVRPRTDNDLLRDFLDHKLSEGSSSEFAKRSNWVLNEYFDFCFSIGKSIRSIGLTEVKRFRIHLVNRSLAPSTVNGYISITRVFYNYLVLVEEVGLNPFRLIELLHIMPVDPPYVPMDQMKKMFEALKHCYYASTLHLAIFECLYATGITGMELMYMRPEDFNFELESLTIRATKRKPQRVVPIPAQSIFVIKHYLIHRKLHHPLASFFIVSKRGRRLYYSLMNKAIMSLLFGTPVRGSKRNQGIAIIKNSYRQHLLSSGVKIETVGQLTGKRMKALSRQSGWRLFADLKRNHVLYHPKG